MPSRPSRTQKALENAETEEDLERAVFLAAVRAIDALTDLLLAAAEKLKR